MSKIVPKLNLNRTPQLVDNNSLVMAKNIRLLEDGTIGPDTSLAEIETNTGDAHVTEIYHEEISEDLPFYQYTILNVRASISLDRGDTIDESQLDDFSFDFSRDEEDEYDDNYYKSDKSKYTRCEDDAFIYCYIFKNGIINWNSYKFKYNYNDNQLINQDGLLLLLAVRLDVYDRRIDETLQTPQFVYLVLPKQYLRQTITISTGGYASNYIIINPIYPTTRIYHHIIQPQYIETQTTYDTIKYISQIVGLNNKVYFFKESNYIKYSTSARTAIEAVYTNETFVENPTAERTATFDVNEDGYITRNGVIFGNTTLATQLTPNFNDRVKIFEFDEVNKTFTIVKCAWKYNGGKDINGCVTVNGTGEQILTICESNFDTKVLVPIKHINLSKCSEDDDESIYSQAPNIPITNLLFHDTYVQQIPSGVYQFFIRYEIREDYYTNWFPCSNEMSSAVKTNINTIQGSILYADLHQDSNQSFIFKVEHLYPEYCKNYTKFQIGFILSHDGGIFARSWKSFPMEDSDNSLIYFNYDKESIKEINIDDLLKVNFDIYNVENVANYKNKLYVADYIESDLNDDNSLLLDFAENINVELDVKEIIGSTYYSLNGYKILSETIDGDDYCVSIVSDYGTLPLTTLYGNENWCSIDTTYTDDEIVFTYLYKEWVLRPESQTLWPVYHEPSAGITDYTNKISLYSLYVYDELDNKIDLITDNSQYIDTLETPADVWNTPINYNQFPNRAVTNKCINTVDSILVGLGLDNKYYIRVRVQGVDKIIKADKLYYKAAYLEKTRTYDQYNVITNRYDRYYEYTRKVFDAELDINTLFNIQIKNDVGNKDTQTLLPFTTYDFYCHFITQNGIITNGYKIKSINIKHWARFIVPSREGYHIISKPSNTQAMLGESLQGTVVYEQDNPEPPTPTPTPVDPVDSDSVDSDPTSVDPTSSSSTGAGDSDPIVRTTIYSTKIPSNCVVYPSFKPKRLIPGNYVGYFISMYKHDNNVCELVDTMTNQEGPEYRYDCIESDALLCKIYNNITIKDWKGDIITTTGKYAPSGFTEENDISKFGDTGFVFFTPSDTLTENRLWIVGNNYASNNYKSLVKVTPIKKRSNNHSILNDQFLQGYFCLVSKLKHKPDNTRIYVSGTDVYNLNVDESESTNSLDLTLNEGKQNIDYSLEYNIHSNYNLNYVSLSKDIAGKIRTYDRTINGETVRQRQVIYSVDSLLASYILILDKTFKEYTRKLFYVKEDNKKTKFYNTIRASNLDVDETYRYIYKFDASDYYIVPSNRGIITNLIAIANTLYVHCEHSLFKFTDNKSLNAQEENVTLQETDIFNSGISEVFDAQYGYAGLKNRKQSLVTYNAYVFYDEVAKVIYAFGGEQQIGSISEPIKKLITSINPKDVQFVGDELHNRFFVNLINDEGNVCLSFNFNSKSFISIHDINFKVGFHTRSNTYFIHENKYEGDIIGWSIYNISDYIDTPSVNDSNVLIHNYIAYQNCYEQSLINISDCDNIVLNPVKSANACVDIIINTEYEKIKTLEYINWICSEIQHYGLNRNLVAEEQLSREYPGTKLRIYTDSTNTDLFELLDSNGNPKIANNESAFDISNNVNAKAYQYPRYNCGIWSLNYFRDISHRTDEFNYNTNVPLPNRREPRQEDSLIYGKYFVLRFIFNNKNFKLENVIFRMSDYEKAK